MNHISSGIVEGHGRQFKSKAASPGKYYHASVTTIATPAVAVEGTSRSNYFLLTISAVPFILDSPKAPQSPGRTANLSKVSFALVIHSHQPVGNFDHVIEDAYQKSYLPFVRALVLHPRIRLSLHFSGILLEWLEKQHPEYFKQLRGLVDRGQIEIVGGGYYEPILDRKRPRLNSSHA